MPLLRLLTNQLLLAWSVLKLTAVFHEVTVPYDPALRQYTDRSLTKQTRPQLFVSAPRPFPSAEYPSPLSCIADKEPASKLVGSCSTQASRWEDVAERDVHDVVPMRIPIVNLLVPQFFNRLGAQEIQEFR